MPRRSFPFSQPLVVITHPFKTLHVNLTDDGKLKKFKQVAAGRRVVPDFSVTLSWPYFSTEHTNTFTDY
jgi:hypothetical protein